ncbi:class I SAM-dependent methyltransferase [Arenibaculum pallidiluteum]|uniref:class I SAM-dependent methyltransferase n=1 Tax=Arenibaculum pallidiluteum TaxID=2812559 RepID=UPI001A956BDC|nr:class I SAM-dependent methyltransferase [Arenibaculum pallidiluteum]
MGRQLNLLVDLPRKPPSGKPKASEDDVRLAQQLGEAYFDGTREQGYGGYRYDGRWRAVARRMAAHYGLGKGSRILDVGCAKGFLVNDFLEEVPGIEAMGVDISLYALTHAVEGAKPHLALANAAKLPYPTGHFDLVISIGALHNILDPKGAKAALAELQRVSRGPGFLVVGACRNDEDRAHFTVAQSVLSPDDWVSLFEQAGYTGDYDWWFPAG